MANGDNSFTFNAGRLPVSRLAVQRFETGPVAIAAGTVFALVNTSTDVLATDGRNQAAQLKDLEVGIYLPTDTADDAQITTKSTLAAVYVAATFFVSTNGQTFQFPVVFNQNNRRTRSALWLALFPNVVRSLAVSVRVDTVDVAFSNYTAYFYALTEFYCVTPE